MSAADPFAGLADAIAVAITDRVLERLGPTLDALRPEPPRRLLTTAETCAALGISRSKLRALRGAGLPAVMVGDAPRFELAAVTAWCRERGGVQ